MSWPIEVVGFDLDGTLVDTMAVVPRVYVETVRSLGGPELTADEVVHVWHVGPTAAVLAHFLGRQATAADLDRYHATFEEAVQDVKPFGGVVDMLDVLAEQGYAVGVYTTATRRAASRMLANAGLGERLPIMVAGDEVTEPKPSPDGLRRLCRQLDTDPRHVAYVGDSEVDARCAHAVGALAIHAAWGNPAIPGDPDEIARTPGDVVDIVVSDAV